MDRNYSSTKLPTTASQSPSDDGAAWVNPANITAEDDTSSTLGYFNGGDHGATITGSDFDFQQLPDEAVVDGISVYIDGSQTGCYGSVELSDDVNTFDSKDMGTLNGSFGGPNDLWGADSIDPADVANLSVSISTGDVSGGDGVAGIDYLTITVYWHIEVENTESDVPTRIDYKVYSRDGNYLGSLPKVTSDLAFPEDINTAGTSIVITCAIKADNEVTVSPLITEAGDEITTEDDRVIVATQTDLLVTTGNSPDEAIFKNSNRIKAYLYNKYYPNGKLMFSGQVNRVNFKYGGGDATVKLTVYSDGLDLNNFIARGYPFSYTTDVSQIISSDYNDVYRNSGKLIGWDFFGQTWRTGASVTNIGSISLRLQGTAQVTLSVYDGPQGNLLGSVTKNVNNGSPTVTAFDFPQLIDCLPSTDYFWGCSVAEGQSIRLYRSNTDVYADGTRYRSLYSGGGSGGGSWQALPFPADYYFVTKSGVPTTTTTYTSDDPVTEMASGILQDYNDRGGLVTERDFEATGLSLTYTFVVAFIYDALKKILELCPTGYYSYIDVGTAEIDIKQVSEIPDYSVANGRQIHELNIDMSIEQVKNYLLLSGGDTGGTNLFRDYKDSLSSSNYGIRTVAKSDNRVTITATANAIGETFIEENSEEIQQTTLFLLNEHIDITLLTPGKTIGFRNYGNFIDDMVLQIVRREGNYNKGTALLTLGRIPIRMTDEVQRINRELLNEQTINNPSAPS